MTKSKYAGRGELFSWCLYDFANSAYTTLIISVAYSVYFTNGVVGNEENLGDYYWGLTLLISNALVALTTPILGSIADLSASKKKFMIVYALMAVTFTGMLFFVKPGMILLGMVLVILSNIGFEGGNAFYNAFLPELGPAERLGRISGYGWALGYVGGLISLATCFHFIGAGWKTPEALLNYRISFLLVAGHYLMFALPAFIFLRERSEPKVQAKTKTVEIIVLGWKRFLSTFREIRKYRELAKFLLTFFIYNDAITTTIGFATIFAVTTIGFDIKEVTILFIVLQLFAMAGAFVFGFVVDRIGAKPSIIITLFVWCGTVVGAYYCYTKPGFYLVGMFAGLAMGSSQAASRTLVAAMSPTNRMAEFFGFFATCGKFAAIIGPFVFGVISSATGNQRLALLSVLFFFITGLLMLWFFVDEEKGRQMKKEIDQAEGVTS
jgi:MFS transporter, UMF1 family